MNGLEKSWQEYKDATNREISSLKQHIKELSKENRDLKRQIKKNQRSEIT